MKIVALEGPSFAGKTQALAALVPLLSTVRLRTCSCYVEEIAEHEAVPPPHTGSTDEQLQAFKFFMAIEARRVAQVAGPHLVDVVLLDRSVDTLLAHAYVLDRLFGYQAYGAASALLPTLPHLQPDRTFYLDAGPATMRRRCQDGGRPFDALLLDTDFINHFRNYFVSSGLAVSRQVDVIDGDQATSLAAEAIAAALLYNGEL